MSYFKTSEEIRQILIMSFKQSYKLGTNYYLLHSLIFHFAVVCAVLQTVTTDYKMAVHMPRKQEQEDTGLVIYHILSILLTL